MAINYETGLEHLNTLQAEYSGGGHDRNEATTRSQLIDTILYDCLGWEKRDVIPEISSEGQYADYTFFAPRAILILEAKREGDYFTVPAGKTHLTYKLASLCHGNPSLKSAIDQVSGYCQQRGVQLAAISNGHQIVAFVANRLDGIPMMEGRALVFPSIAFMVVHFLDLWNALSKSGLEEKVLHKKLFGTSEIELPLPLAQQIDGYPGTKGRNIFQAELQVLSETVIEDIAQSVQLEEEFLEKCYCSAGQLPQHSLATRSLLAARYAALFSDANPGPALAPAMRRDQYSPELLADSLKRRPVLLLGDVGSGKSIFLRKLLRLDAKKVLENAIALHVDLKSEAVVPATLKETIVSRLTEQLANDHDFNIDHANNVVGIHYSQLDDFRTSIYGRVRETNPALYEVKELEFLEKLVANRSQHLKRALDHLVHGRQKQIVIILDNLDQHTDSVQDEAFLVAQEFAEHWPVLVFLPLRPETFHRSQQEGALSGYHPKAFTIAPPSIELVIRKRLEFAIQLTNGSLIIPALPGEASRNLHDLESLIHTFLASLNDNHSLRECIENIAGGNVRLALDLVRSFFGSGHVDTRKIVDIVSREGGYKIPLHEFLRAVIFGNTAHFDPSSSPVANVYDISTVDGKEHFSLPIVLAYLRSAMSTQRHTAFVETTELYDQMQNLGFVPDQVDFALVRALRKKLVDSEARRKLEQTTLRPRAYRITTTGLYHVGRLCGFFTYVDAIVEATPVLDPLVRNQLFDTSRIDQRLDRAEIFRHYLDSQWQGFNCSRSPFHWDEVSASLAREVTQIRARALRR